MTINIAMTSFPRRITNCVKVINSILDNTVQPDRIYLTLSHLEFPNYEQDLPSDLYRLIMTSNKVILNWVEKNHKSMKKVFPILQYLEDDDVIIDIDDDMLLPKDFIESRVNDFERNGKSHPITSNLKKSINLDNLIMSCYSLFQKRMLNGYEKFLVPEVLNTFNDDRTYLYLCHLNGYKLVSCTKYCTNRDSTTILPLQLAPHSDYKYNIGPDYDRIVAPIISKLSNGKKINDCFGLFSNKEMKIEQDYFVKELENKLSVTKFTSGIDCVKFFEFDKGNEVKHDVVYVLGKGSKKSNLEIKISITALLKFCQSWLGNIYVVGENPHIRNPRVKHLYVPDITKVNKDANIINKLYMAIQKIPSLTNNFLFCSDDILVTKPTNWSDFHPMYVFEYNQNPEVREQLYNKSRGNLWDKLLLETLERFIGHREHIWFYEPHVFVPINKESFVKMCRQIDYVKQKNVIIMSLWFNWLNIGNPIEKHDHQSVFKDIVPDMSKLKQHLTYNDKAFCNKQFRDRLIEFVTK